MNDPTSDFRSQFYARFIMPKSQATDSRRRELLVNILLCGLTIISLIATLSSILNHLQGHARGDVNSIPLLFVFTVVIICLWKLSRLGYFELVSYLLLGFLFFGALQLMLHWSFDLQVAELLLVLIIVMAGVLLSARAALRITGLTVAYLLGLSYLQTQGYQHPDLHWTKQRLEISDAVGMSVLLAIIGLVSWLSNREIDRSLARARASEAALEQERDSLEVKVAERTRELEQAQLARVMELQRLAEFGRLSAGLLHEVANPLTVASLNLEQLSNQPKPVLLKRALQSLHYIERYLDAARKQLKGQGNLISFSPQQEVRQVMAILQHRAREYRVKLRLEARSHKHMYGDSVKFSQLMTNLIINAIEAYEGVESKNHDREVTITIDVTPQGFVVAVHDWGRGLSATEREKIFQPFYSTKADDHRNMGIGLAMVREIIDDAGGKISVSSTPQRGTTFTVQLASQQRPKP